MEEALAQDWHRLWRTKCETWAPGLTPLNHDVMPGSFCKFDTPSPTLAGNSQTIRRCRTGRTGDTFGAFSNC
eukprot:3323842-Karenia_brevis.AAC.1